MLGASPELAYFREPVTQSWLRRSHEPLVDPEADPKVAAAYGRLADLAFRGLIPPGYRDAPSFREFFPLTRRRRQLFIKEINPLAAELFIERFAPRVLFLWRHPAAVAESFARLGWLADRREELFEGFGRDYATVMERAGRAVSRTEGCEIRYERIARQPAAEFHALYEYLGVRPPRDFEEMLRSFCETPGDTDAYAIQRVSNYEIDKWKRNLAPGEIEAVRRGYFAADPQHYTEDRDWT